MSRKGSLGFKFDFVEAFDQALVAIGYVVFSANRLGYLFALFLSIGFTRAGWLVIDGDNW